ncbi:MAG: cytochrome c oxidase subunit II [Hyphomicrobiales bacterium]
MRSATWRRNFRKSLTIFSAALSALLISVGIASAGFGQPAGITDEAHDMHDLYLLLLAMAAVVFIGVEAMLLFIIFRYRRRNDDLPPQTHGNNFLEVVWTSIPIIIVLILFVFSFIVLVDVDDSADSKDLTVDVEGFQFQWSFRYNLNDLGPGSDPNKAGYVSVTGTAAEEPTLVIPVDEPVEFRLHSNDVIHSFYVRDFLYKLDVIPGRDNRFVVTARELGTFHGQCAELCGLNHADMIFHLKVVTREEFDQYIASLPVQQDENQQGQVRKP